MIGRRPPPSETHRLLHEELREERASVRRLTEELRRREADVRDAEHRVRHEVADALHDEVLQDLLAAGQDVAEAVNRLGDDATLTRAAEGIDRSAAQLRGLLGAMQTAPPAMDGLSAALADVADRLSRQGGMAVHWSVAPDAEGPHDALVLSLARELLVNVAKHAHARRATATVSRRGDTVVVRVTDDGRGYPDGRLEEAAREGHIGLTSALAKARAVGGTVEVAGSSGRGTTAVVRLPLP